MFKLFKKKKNCDVATITIKAQTWEKLKILQTQLVNPKGTLPLIRVIRKKIGLHLKEIMDNEK